MATEAVDSFYKRMLGQLNFEKSEKYAKKFVLNLFAYETGKLEKQVALRPIEIKDPQIQNIFFIGAGLRLMHEEFKLKGQSQRKTKRGKQAVKELLSDLYPGMTASRLLESRPKVVEVKEACFELGFPGLQFLPTALTEVLKDLDKNPVSSCASKTHVNYCKNGLMECLQYLKQHEVPKDLERRLEKRIETEINGLHFYMAFRSLWATFDKPAALHDSKKKFEDALDACEKAYVRIEEDIFRVEKEAAPRNLRKKTPRLPSVETTKQTLKPEIQEKILQAEYQHTRVEPQMTEDVGDRNHCSRTNAIQVKPIELSHELEMHEKSLQREERYQREIATLRRELEKQKRQPSKQKENRLKADVTATESEPADAFPKDEEAVSDKLIQSCVAVDNSKWEEIGHFLLSSNRVEEIRNSSSRNTARMFKVLETWRMKKSPTVGQLLEWFEQVDVHRNHIKKKYIELPK